MVLEGITDDIAAQLGGIIGALTAEIVHPDLAAMEVGQEFIHGREAVAEETCRARSLIRPPSSCSYMPVSKWPRLRFFMIQILPCFCKNVGLTVTTATRQCSSHSLSGS